MLPSKFNKYVNLTRPKKCSLIVLFNVIKYFIHLIFLIYFIFSFVLARVFCFECVPDFQVSIFFGNFYNSFQIQLPGELWEYHLGLTGNANLFVFWVQVSIIQTTTEKIVVQIPGLIFSEYLKWKLSNFLKFLLLL